MLGFAISIKTLTELFIFIFIIGSSSIYVHKTGPVVYDVFGYDGMQDSIKVAANHKPKGNYFCPKYCDVEHAHVAHPFTWKCSLDDICNHYLYIIPPDSIKPRRSAYYKK